MERASVSIGDRHDLRGCLREILHDPFWKKTKAEVPTEAYCWQLPQLAVTALSLSLSCEPTMKDRFADSRALTAALFCKRHQPGKTFQGFCDAWRRVGLVLGLALRRRLQDVLWSETEKENWIERAFAVDGSRQGGPHSLANVEALGETRVKGRTESGPQLLVGAAVHLSSRVLYDWESTSGNGSEPELLERVIERLPDDVLVVKDAGTVGADWIWRVLAKQRHLLMRVAGNFRLYTETVAQTAARGGPVVLWAVTRPNEPPLSLRLIAIPLPEKKAPPKRKRKKGAKRNQDGKTRRRYVYLVTDLTRAELSDEGAAELYRLRWGANEIGFRGWKETLDKRKLLSRTPEMAYLEHFYSLLAMQLLQVMQFAATGGAPRPGSLAETWRLWRRAVRALVAGRCFVNFGAGLKECVLDGYQRRRPRQRRCAPHKKRPITPGAPVLRKITKATKSLWKRKFQYVG